MSAALFIFWIFIFKTSASLKNEEFYLRDEFETKQEKFKKTKNMETVLSEFKAEKDAAAEIILTKDDFIKLIKNIESLSKTAGVKLDIKSAAVGDSGTAPVLDLEAKGDFTDLYRFIKMVENFPYVVSFERLTLQKNSPGNLSQSATEETQKNEKQNYKWLMETSLKILSYKNGG